MTKNVLQFLLINRPLLNIIQWVYKGPFINYDLGRVGKLEGEGLLFFSGYWHGEGLDFLGYCPV